MKILVEIRDKQNNCVDCVYEFVETCFGCNMVDKVSTIIPDGYKVIGTCEDCKYCGGCIILQNLQKCLDFDQCGQNKFGCREWEKKQ